MAHLLDRALGRLVPEIVASACYPPDPWRETLPCPQPCLGTSYRDCHYACNGSAVCGPWHIVWI